MKKVKHGKISVFIALFLLMGAVTAVNAQTPNDANLWSVGASLGTSFNAPWVIVTARGTIAPWRYSFLELGIDAGFVSGVKAAESYFSVYPFAHYVWYMPLKVFIMSGFYIGGGGGYMIARYTYPGEKVSADILAMDITAGVNILDMINVSYTVRENFWSGFPERSERSDHKGSIGVNHKVSVGYFYRFR